MSTTRKAPSESATLFKKGTIKKGNDEILRKRSVEIKSLLLPQLSLALQS